MNNECDPQVGWKDVHTWHARPYYAAWTCRSAVQHLEDLVDGLGVDYALLSNDHGFIGAWGNRTLLARFGSAGWIEDGQGGHAGKHAWDQRDFTTPDFAMVKKPAFAALELLSLLGEQRLAWQTGASLPQPGGDARLSVLPTRAADGCLSVLVTWTRDRINSSGSLPLRLRLEGIPFDEGMLAHFRIDEDHTDPYRLWEAAGAPDLPEPDLLAAMRAAQEPALLEEPSPARIVDGALEINFELPLHGVSLLLLAPRPAQPPDPVTGLRYERFAGLHDQPEYLLRWDPLPERSIRSYEVLFAPQPGGELRRASPASLISAAWLSTLGPGAYQVIARDLWGRASQPGETLIVR